MCECVCVYMCTCAIAKFSFSGALFFILHNRAVSAMLAKVGILLFSSILWWGTVDSETEFLNAENQRFCLWKPGVCQIITVMHASHSLLPWSVCVCVCVRARMDACVFWTLLMCLWVYVSGRSQGRKCMSEIFIYLFHIYCYFKLPSWGLKMCQKENFHFYALYIDE